MWGRVEVLEQLSKAGVKLNEELDKEGNTLLHIAGSFAQAKACTTLIALGLSTTALNNLGQTPLVLAQALSEERYMRAETIAALSTSPQSPKKKK